MKKVDVEEAITKPKAKSLNEIVREMHTRILKKSKNKLTVAINDRIKDKDNDEIKTNVKELKNVIVTLEQSERDGNHLSTIRNVTNDGNDLFSSTSSINSNDVLERVKIYHDI